MKHLLVPPPRHVGTVAFVHVGEHSIEIIHVALVFLVLRYVPGGVNCRSHEGKSAHERVDQIEGRVRHGRFAAN